MEYDSEPLNSGLEQELKHIEAAYINELMKSLKIDSLGWVYVSTNLSKRDFNNLIKTVGVENTKIVSTTNTVKNVRFSMFLSPDGINKLKTYYEGSQ